MNYQRVDETEVIGAIEQVLVFMLEDEELCVPVEIVQDVVCLYEGGIVHVRGKTIPVEDLRIRLGMAPIERSARQRVLVLKLAGELNGFLVDSVVDVQGVLPSNRVPLPQFPCASSLLPAHASDV